jgi:hypothetical protein
VPPISGDVLLSNTRIALELERARDAALPGRETVERDSVLRELHRLLQTTTRPSPVLVWAR